MEKAIRNIGMLTVLILISACTLRNPESYIYDTSKQYNGILRGHIQDPFESPVVGMSVILRTEKGYTIKGTVTDISGNFQFNDLPPLSACVLDFDGFGYSVYSIRKIDIVNGDNGYYCVTFPSAQSLIL